MLTHYLPLYFPEAERFHRSSRSDWFFAFLERYPSPHIITTMAGIETAHMVRKGQLAGRGQCARRISVAREQPSSIIKKFATVPKIAPMLGIDQPVMIDAKLIMGREAAAITILCMLEKAAAIRSPGAYLRRLTQMARDGVFSPHPMLTALANREIVS